jgi:serine/threonine-protein kinase
MSARVNHSNVAKTLDYFEANKKGHLVEELIEGRHLGEHLESNFAYLDPHLAARLISCLARGLSASHHVKVIHRDLKPSNILVSSDPGFNLVKVTDFGIAKLALDEMEGIDVDDGGSITGSQTVLGAIPYMSPEMIESAKSAKLPADVWALGAILYRTLTGDYAFGTGLKAVANILEAKVPPRPSIFDSKKQFTSLANELWEIVLMCLQKDPGDRPTADQLVQRCASLCYSSSPRSFGEVIETRFGSQGTIMGKNGKLVFFHSDSVFGTFPKVGARVNFASSPGSPRPRAFPVLPIK